MIAASDGARVRRVLAVWGLVLFFAVLLWPVPPSCRAAWMAAVLDASHIPLLAGVTLVGIAFTGRTAWGCGLGMVLAAAGEAVQFLVGRVPSWIDLAYGLAGVLLGGAGWAVWQQPRSRRRWCGLLASAAVAAGGVACYAAPVWLDALLAYQALPVLSDFRSPWEPQRWRADAAVVRRVPAEPLGDGWEGQIDFLPAEGSLSGIILCPLLGDWSAYEYLHFELACSEELPRVMLSVRDARKVRPPQRRFEYRAELAAGDHHLVLDLRQLAAGGEFAALDLRRIQSLHLCLEDVGRPRTLTVRRIWLE